MSEVELFGGSGCQYTSELREQLIWDGREFIEYDVETNEVALRRMIELTDGQRTIPVLVVDGHVAQIGWQGRGCIVAPP